MTNTTPHGQVPEALRLAEQYDHGDPAAHGNAWKAAVCTELRRLAKLEAQIEALSGVQALSAAPAGPWSLGEMTGNWRDIDLPDHGGVMRVVWRMEEDDGKANPQLEAQAHAVVAALNAASSTPLAPQQAATKAAPQQEAQGLVLEGYTLPPLPEPDLRDVGTKPQDIKDFLRGYATEYAKRALRLSQPAPAPLSDDSTLLDWLAIRGSFGIDSSTGEVGGNGQKRVAATRKNIRAALAAQGGKA